MIKFILLLLFSTLVIFAGEKVTIPAYAALTGFLVTIGLFFWGVYKAVQTQKNIYALAMLPFVILLFWMFFI